MPVVPGSSPSPSTALAVPQLNLDVPDQRIRQGAAATLSVTLTDQDGEAADSAGTVTVGVTKADGTVVVGAGTATSHGATGVYTTALTAAETATLEMLVATWTDTGDGSTTTTLVEIVGGFYFSVAEARASDATLADAAKYPSSAIHDTRREVEDECEFICDVAFVPRYRRVTLSGAGSRDLLLPDNQLRRVRSVRVYSDATTYSTFTTAQLAALAVSDDDLVQRSDGNIFDDGLRNVVVEYEHGYDRPPADLKRATLTRLRHRLNAKNSGIPDRATSFTSTEGGTFRLDTPDAFKTGIPDVDAVYARYSRRSQGGTGPVPASRAVDFDSARLSVYHGGRR